MAIQLVINVNSQGAVTEINQITGAFDKLGNELKQTNTQLYSTGSAVNRIEKDAGTAGGAFSKFQANVIAINSAVMLAKQGFDFVAGALGGFVEVSSRANETQSKFNYTFLESSTIANQVASDISASYQRSNIAVQEGIATFGAFLKPLGMAGEKGLEMAAALEKLTLDLASFNNTTDEEMFQKLMSGMAGETEAVRRLGIDISEVAIKHELLAMGVKKASDQVTQAEKVQARFNLIMKQTSLQQGDVARTSESWANQTKAAAAAFEEFQKSAGDALINALLPYVKELSAWFKDNKEQILAFGKSAAETIGSLISGVVEVVKVLYKMKDIIILAGEAYLTYFAGQKIMIGMQLMAGAFQTGITAIKTFHNTMISYANISQQPFAATMGFSQKMGMAVNATTGSVSALSASFTGLSGVIANIGPAVITAFATYAITDFILEATGAKQAMFEFFSELEAEEIAAAQREADLRNGLSAQAWQRAAVNNTIREQGALLGVNSLSVLENAKAILQNKEAFSKLSPEIQGTIVKMAGVRDEIDKTVVAEIKHVKAIEDSKKAQEEYLAAFEKVAGAVGLYTEKTLKDQRYEMTAMQQVWKSSSGLILKNSDMTDKFNKSVWGMIENIKANGKEVPSWLTEIGTALNEQIFKNQGLANIPTMEYAELLKALDPLIQDQINALPKLGVKMIDTADKEDKLNKKIQEQKKSILDLVPVFKNMIDGLEKWGMLSSKSAGQISTLTNSFAGLYQSQLDLDALNQKYEKGENVTFGETFSQGLSLAITTFSTFYSLIETFFGRNWEAEATSRMQGLYGVTSEMVSQLEKVAEETGSMDEAFKKLFATMVEGADITDAMGLNSWLGSYQDMLDQVLGSIEQVHEAIGSGKKPGEQGTNEDTGSTIGTSRVTSDLEKGFDALLKKGKELGVTLTKSFLDVVRAGDELFKQGQKIGAIWDYQNESLKSSTSSMSDYFNTFADQSKLKDNLAKVRDEYESTSKEIADKIAKLQEDLLGEGLTDTQRQKIKDEIESLSVQFNGLSGKYNESIGVAQKAIYDAIQDVSKNWDFINTTTASQIAALQIQGISTFDIYSKYMKDNLGQIAAMAKESGLDVSKEIADMIGLSDFVTANENLVNRIDATRLAMEGLANANKLTENQFKAFSQQTIDQFNSLVAAGGGTEEALKNAFSIMGVNLQDIIAMSKAYGYTIDDATQALIDQGFVSGDLAKQKKTAQDTEIAGSLLIYDALFAVVEILGGTMPDAVKKSRDALAGLTTSVQDSSDVAAAAVEGGGSAVAVAVAKSVQESEKLQNRSFMMQKANAEKASSNLSEVFSKSENTVTGKIQKIGDSFTTMVDGMLNNTDRWVLGLGGVINSLDAINGKIVTLPDMKFDPVPKGGELPGFANGGQFTVQHPRGWGAVDTTLVAFRATQGEVVTVQTPQQAQQNGGSNGAVNSTRNTTINIPVTVTQFSDYQVSDQISRIIRNKVGPLWSTIQNV